MIAARPWRTCLRPARVAGNAAGADAADAEARTVEVVDPGARRADAAGQEASGSVWVGAGAR